MTGEQMQLVARALLPGLHYLAAEALRAGCQDISRIIFDAISKIERRLPDQGEDHEQRDLRAPAIGRDVAR